MGVAVEKTHTHIPHSLELYDKWHPLGAYSRSVHLDYYQMCHCLCSPSPLSHLDNKTAEDTIHENKIGARISVACN